jgi:predicted transcriptional regulator
LGRPTKKELKEDAVSLRRDRILELTSQGYSQRQIANILQVSNGTVGNDQIFLRQKAKENIKKYVDEKLPEEYERCLVGITTILREAWDTSHRTDINSKEKIQALSLAKECYSMKLDLLTNATIVSDAVRFVSEHYRHENQNNKIDSNCELLHNADSVTDAVTTNKVF